MSPRVLLLLTALNARREPEVARDASDARRAAARVALDGAPPAAVRDAWSAAARDARIAWDAWRASAIRDRGEAYARYRASLDREERAAEMLAAALSPERAGRASRAAPCGS
jgi:hypothetical protein